jgi:hypothetical protein
LQYIKQKEEEFLETRYAGAQNIPTYQAIMHMAYGKFIQLSDQGLWCTPMEEQQDIITLEAKWEKKYQAQVKMKKPAEKAGNNKKGKGKGKKDKKGKDKEKSNKKPDWMLKEPTGSKPKTKTMNQKEYHWCPNHKCWTRHKPSECNGHNAQTGNNAPPAKRPQGNIPGLQIASTYHAIADADE